MITGVASTADTIYSDHPPVIYLIPTILRHIIKVWTLCIAIEFAHCLYHNVSVLAEFAKLMME